MNEVTSALAIKEFDPFQLMDALDDEAILAEIEGRISKSWAYHFEQFDPEEKKMKEVWGLSKVGVDAACREMAKQGEAIREETVEWSLDPTGEHAVLFKAFASRFILSKDGQEVMLERAAGTKRQGLMTKRRDGKEVPNAFWFEQGSMKALRNARTRLLSEEVRAKIINTAKELGKVKKLIPPTKEVPPWQENFDASIAKEMEIHDKGGAILLGVLGSFGYSTLEEVRLQQSREVATKVYREYLNKLKEVPHAST